MRLRHPSVLSAYAGRNDGKFCKLLGEQGLGMVTLGGISVDDASKRQSKKIVARGRKEFILDDHLGFIRNGIALAKESGAVAAVNIRSATMEGYLSAAEVIADAGGAVEIDAHCRQPEMIEIGAGQALLGDMEKLKDILYNIKAEFDIETILKFRGNVVSERMIALSLNDCCDALHVDAMMQGSEVTDMNVFLNIPDGIFLIGNNSVTDVKSALAILEFCDAFSFARLANDIEKTNKMLKELMDD
ncbi:MAG: hydrolase [Candidatus Methanofastidiosa archaeon]|nr:hydrolase [Candidatus Methanofastidiosa archaeon]